MKFRTTVIAALLLAVFGAYVYFFEYKKAEEEKKQEEEAKKVFSIDWDKLKGLKIKNAHGTFVLEKVTEAGAEGASSSEAPKSEWRITQPVETRADPMTVEGLVTNLKGVKREQVVTEKAENLDAYGLKDPAIRITVLPGEGDKAPASLLVGATSPVGSNSYAMWEGGDKVLLLSSNLTPQFDKGLYDLRHKKLFAFKRDDVERIRIVRSEAPEIDLARKGDGWKIVKPIHARASETEINQILDKLANLKAVSFDDENPKDLSAYGLDKPVWRIEVALKPDQTRIALLLGSMHETKGKGSIYAKRGDRPTVVSLGMDLIGTFAKGPKELREKRVMPFKTWKIHKLELAGKGLNVTLEKKEGDRWWIEAPIKARADGSKMTVLLGALNRLEGEEFLEKPKTKAGLARFGLADPLARVTLYEGKPPAGGKKKGEEAGSGSTYPLFGKFLLGKVQEKGKDVYYATTEGDETVYRVSGDFYKNSFPADVEALRSKKVAAFSRYLVAGIEAKGPEGPVLIRRKENRWELEKPHSGEVDRKKVDALLTQVLALEVDRFVENVPEDLSAWGLDPAASELVFRNDKGKEMGAVLFSARGPEGEKGLIYVRERGEPWVGLIQADKKKALMDKLAACVPEG